ncbi:MAG: DUF3566 domain-containing protein [Acidimicrobiia bacterium]
MTTVRRVRRIIRKIDPWTVLKVSAILNVVLAIGIVLGLVMFWTVITAAGIPEKVTEILIQITLLDVGEDPFANTERFLRAAVFGAVVWAVLATGLATVMAVMYNLVTDVVGGIEVVVLEESLSPVAVATSAPAPRMWTPAPTAGTSPANGGKTTDAEVPTEETPVTAGDLA